MKIDLCDWAANERERERWHIDTMCDLSLEQYPFQSRLDHWPPTGHRIRRAHMDITFKLNAHVFSFSLILSFVCIGWHSKCFSSKLIWISWAVAKFSHHDDLLTASKYPGHDQFYPVHRPVGVSGVQMILVVRLTQFMIDSSECEMRGANSIWQRPT